MQKKSAKPSFPSLRALRRACNRELYRTIKKLKIWIPPDQVVTAEKFYLKKVVGNLQWIVENRDNRKKQADWWEKEVCPEIAGMWNVEAPALAEAFRSAFGG